MENLLCMHPQKTKVVGLISHKCLTYERWKFILQPVSVCQGFLRILEPLAAWSLVGFSPLALFAQRSNPPQAFSELTCSSLQYVCPELQFLCCSQINSISGNWSLP